MKYRLIVRFGCGHATDGDADPVPADARDDEAAQVVRAKHVCPACYWSQRHGTTPGG